MNVLFVCTGNICRSAAAELLVANTHSTGVPLRVASAGTHARAGRGVHPMTATAIERFSINVAGFRSQMITRDLVAQADLVLTMTTQHREDVLAMNPRRMDSVYTLREAAVLFDGLTRKWADMGSEAGGRALAGELAAARARMRRGHADHDIADPVDGPAELHRKVVGQIATALSTVLAGLKLGSITDHQGQQTRPPVTPMSEPVSDDTLQIRRLPPVPVTNRLRGARRPGQ